MTREELCIHACKYAIGELTRKGSSAFITSAHEGRQQITWVEIMEWLNREQQEDAISRQAAIDIASGYCHPSNIAKELAKLPSVQPKYNTSEWCHDCSEYDHDKHCCPRYNGVIRKAVEEIKQCEDAISRQAVLAIANDSCLDLDSYEDTREFCDEIKSLPSVTQQPKTGHWIDYPQGELCSVCQLYVSDRHNDDFCPHCGARMVESQEKVRDKE